MKKLYWLWLCVFTLTFAGCDKEDDTNFVRPTPTPTVPPTPTYDTAPPQVIIYSPQQEDIYLAIGVIGIYAEISDNVRLDKVGLFLVSPSGERKRLEIINPGHEHDDKRESISQILNLEGGISGNYTIIVEAEDRAGNTTSKSVSIKVITEDISRLDFKTAFTSTGWFEQVDWGLGNLDIHRFNYAFHSIINKYQWDYGIEPAYLNEFGLDFGGHSQLWDKWDKNKNQYLEYSEFEKGLDDLKFFTEWDKNQDNLISEEEFTDGIAILWDVNKDNVVTADEFERKLIKYFLY